MEVFCMSQDIEDSRPLYGPLGEASDAYLIRSRRENIAIEWILKDLDDAMMISKKTLEREFTI
jgi:hypothetical protein